MDKVGDSLTDWGREFQRMGEAREADMGGGNEGAREQEVLGGTKRTISVN